MKLWEVHFSHAGEIEEAGTYDPTKWEPVIKETILNFLNLSDEKMTQGKY